MRCSGLFADKVAAILNTLWIGWGFQKRVNMLKA